MRKTLIPIVLFTCLPLLTEAQQPTPPASAVQPQASVLVVSQNKCSFAQLDQLNSWVQTTWAPVLNRLVREGLLTSWGVLNHSWGDEWNWVIYYGARDLVSFHRGFDRFFTELRAVDPNLMARISSSCSEHRDNIYTVVLTDRGAPPRATP